MKGNEMINVAVVGCGYWGPNLIRNFSLLSECHVKYACDLEESRLQHIKSVYPKLETATKFETVIDDRDVHAVAIATPVRSHHLIAKACLESGKHVFIEKPMAGSVEECNDLINIAEKNNLKIVVGHTFMYSPPVRKIKEIIQRGTLGEVLYVSARRLNLGLFQKDINVAWDLAPHDISIILYVLGQIPESVNCQGQAHINPDIEDVTVMTMKFGRDGFAIIQSSWLDPNKVREMTFVGSKRMLVYDDLEQNEKIKIYDKRVETPPYYDTFAEFQYAYHYGDIYSPYLKMYEPLRMECQQFIDCIQNGSDCESDGYNGLQVVSILEGAIKSLKTGGVQVNLKPLRSFLERQHGRAAA
jgi:predicted dehydrogenase